MPASRRTKVCAIKSAFSSEIIQQPRDYATCGTALGVPRAKLALIVAPFKSTCSTCSRLGQAACLVFAN